MTAAAAIEAIIIPNEAKPNDMVVASGIPET
jgi:hypothetical protein